MAESPREIACIYYEYEGSCLKGRKGLFRSTCQICKKYTPRKGGVPARKNLKREKMGKLKAKDIAEMLNNY